MGVNPTLLIGLGGTGREVLSRVRRRFFEEGFLAQPWISYLWIDTEASQPNSEYSPSLPFDYVARRTALKRDQGEVCDIGVTFARAQEVQQNLSAYKNLWEWCEPDVLGDIMKENEALTNGAKQQPPLGRLALFLKANEVQRTLLQRLNALNKDTMKAAFEEAYRHNEIAEKERPNLARTDKYNILIVGSLAGGTGAGCCIDVAAMLRPCMDNKPNEMFETVDWLATSSIMGYFVLPMAFARDPKVDKSTNFKHDRVYANGYAMLQELEMVSLNRSKNKQFLTGRDKSGLVHATWRYAPNPQAAPWVEAPIYQTCVLFDGYGDSNNPINAVNDNYELVANIIHSDLSPSGALSGSLAAARSNQTLAAGEGHLETIPKDKAPDHKDALWTDVYSFRFAAAGLSRITFEAPRLRLMAIYTMAEKALDQWLGEDLNLKPEEDENKAKQFAEKAERRKLSTLERLRQELLRQTNAGGTPWVDVWKGQRQSAAVTELVNLAVPKGARNFRLKPLLDRLDREMPKWDYKNLVAQLVKEYFDVGSQRCERLERVLRKLVDSPPLADIKHGLKDPAKVYTRPGGVAAAELAVQAVNGLISQIVNEQIAKREGEAAVAKESLEKLRAAAGAAVKEADDALADCETVLNDWAAWPGTKKQVLQKTMAVVEQAKNAMKTWTDAQTEFNLKSVIAQAWRAFQTDPEFIKNMDDYRNQLDLARRYLTDLLTHRKNDANKADPCGLRPILNDLRGLETGSLTQHLGGEIQKHPEQLNAELRKVYGGKPDDDEDNALLNGDVIKIQEEILNTWGGLLEDLVKPNPIPKFEHIFEVAIHPKIVDSMNEVLPVRLHLDKQIDRLVDIARAKSRANQLLSDRSVRLRIGDPELAWLEQQSQVRLEIDRGADNAPRRRPANFQKKTGPERSELTEHRVLLAPDGFAPRSLADKNFAIKGLSSDLEVTAIRFEFDVPLPNIKTLYLAAQSYSNWEPRKLHFTYPKSGYLPVHSLTETEAREYRQRTLTALLALILGQFRPSERDKRMGDKEPPTFFEFRMDPARGPLSCDEAISSISDVVRYLGQNKDFCRNVEQRNREIMNDLSPHALIALELIIEYNLRFIAPLAYQLCSKERAKEILDVNPNFQQEVRPYGPQQLLLEAIYVDVDRVLRSRYQGPPRDFDIYCNNTRAILSDWLQHFSVFVPSRLRKRPEEEPSQPFLCLLTEIEKERGVPVADDLLQRKPPEPGEEDTRQVWGRLALKAPWTLYNDALGRQVLATHFELTRPDSSMEPPAKGERVAKPIPNGWEGPVYYNQNAVKISRFYRKLFKTDDMLSKTDREIWDGYAQERFDLARKQERLATPIALTAEKPSAHAVAAVHAPPPPPATAPFSPPPPPPAAPPASAPLAFMATVGGQQFGPLDMVGLQALAQTGTITPQTMVWKAGMAVWAPAGQVPELGRLFSAPPPPPPQMPPPPA